MMRTPSGHASAVRRARGSPLPAMAARRERCSLLLARRGTRLLLLSRVSSLTVPFPRLDPAQTSLVATPRSRFAPSSSRAATPRARDRRARVAFFVSHSTRALAEAIAARVRAAHDVDVAWFTVSERDGTIDPPVPSADALHAAVTKPLAAAAASSPRSPIRIEGPSDAAPSAAALIAKGEAAVRLGDHRRANEAFAAARAMQELERSPDPPRRPAGRAPPAPADFPKPTLRPPPSSPRSRPSSSRSFPTAPPTSESPSTPPPRRTCARVPPPSSVRTPPAASAASS